MNWKRSVLAGAGLLVAVTVAGVSYGVTRGGADDGEGIATLDPSDWPMRVAVSSPYPRPEVISEYQWAMVNDGWVSDEEMRAAVDATIACAADAGLRVSTTGGEEGRVSRSLTYVSDSPAPVPAFETCKWENMEAVSMMYGRQFAAHTFVTQPEHDARWENCLATRGFEGEWPEILARRIADLAVAAALEHCSEAVNTAAVGNGPEHERAYSAIESCLGGHGYFVPPLAERSQPFWTSERLNSMSSVRGLPAVFRTCQVVHAMTQLSPSR